MWLEQCLYLILLIFDALVAVFECIFKISDYLGGTFSMRFSKFCQILLELIIEKIEKLENLKLSLKLLKLVFQFHNFSMNILTIKILLSTNHFTFCLNVLDIQVKFFLHFLGLQTLLLHSNRKIIKFVP